MDKRLRRWVTNGDLLVKIVLTFVPVLFLCIAASKAFPAADECLGGRFGLRGLHSKSKNNIRTQQEVFANVVEARARWCQTLARWKAVEPSKPTNGIHHYDWSRLDDFIRTAFEHNICVNVIFKSFSKWGAPKSTVLPSEANKAGRILRSAAPDPVHLSDWKTFVKTVVERYDGDGEGNEPKFITSRKNVKYWHVESEPGGLHPPKGHRSPGSAFWYGTPSEYAQHFVETSAAIREADRDAKVVLGGFVSKSVLADPKRSYVFQVLQAMREIRKKKGIAVDFDIFDCHHFRDVVLIDQIGARIDDILRTNGFVDKQKWVTQTTLGSRVLNRIFRHNISRKEYLAYLAQDLVKRHVSFFASGFEKVFYVKLADWGSDFTSEILVKSRKGLSGKLPFHKYSSLLDSRHKPKPQFYTYRLLAEKLDLFTSVATVNTGHPSVKGYRFEFDTKGPVYVLWSTGLKEASCDLSRYFGKKEIKITNIVEHEGKNKPDVRVILASSIPVSSSPIFLEE